MRYQTQILSVHLSGVGILFLLLIGFSLLFARNVSASSVYQDRADLNSVAQKSASTEPEMKAFRDGREALADERWERAAERFNDFVEDYPKSKNVDAALYWLAFALKRQERFREADKALARLINDFPASSWSGDAQAMRVEIAPQIGNSKIITAEASQSDNDEAKLVALRNLFKSDPPQALTVASNIFQPGSTASRSFKESTIMLVGRYAGEKATPMLVGLARNESEPRLRKTAIFWLGRERDESVIATLKELALQSDDNEVALAAVSAILQHGSQRALESINEIAGHAKSQEVRRQSAALLGTQTKSDGLKMKGVWLLIRERNQVLTIPTGRIIKLVGFGNLKFKQDGRLLEIPEHAYFTVNGQPIFRENEVRKGESAQVIDGAVLNRERIVRENEVVRVIGEDDKLMWELSLYPDERSTASDGGDWLNINGEFAFNTNQSKTFLLYPKPGGGIRLRR
ncbi:MAG TPA: HEAT repeat domain-containing protein [Pyrinomonadaceae bacterium]